MALKVGQGTKGKLERSWVKGEGGNKRGRRAVFCRARVRG